MNSVREKRKCVIIGSGPAGYTAAIYAARAELKPLLYEGMQPGGQLTITTEVENFPGYPKGITGPSMMDEFKQQAEKFGAEIRPGFIDKVSFTKNMHILTDESGREIEAETVIIATGASARWLGLPSEQAYNGFGVSACATCDGYFYRDKVVCVIGGGDTAAEEAVYLSKLASKVYLIHRRDELRASKAMQKNVFNSPNIEMVWNAIPKEIIGEQKGFAKSVTGIIVEDVKTNNERTIQLDGVFVAIGHTPNTELFKDKIDLYENGYIKTIPGTTKTSVEGIFAAGDVQDTTYRQAITAAGTGCMAAIEAERYLSSKE